MKLEFSGFWKKVKISIQTKSICEWTTQSIGALWHSSQYHKCSKLKESSAVQRTKI